MKMQLKKRVSMLFVCLLTLVSLVPKSASAQASEATTNTVTFRLNHILIYNETDPEDVGPFNPEDDPYFIVIKFRSRFFTPDSTQVVVCGHTPNSNTDDRLCGRPRDFEDLDGGEEADIPEDMSGATFPNVHYSTLDSLVHGDYPEVIGVALVAMENDESLGKALDKAAEEAEKVRSELVAQVEKGAVLDKFLESKLTDDDSSDASPLKGVGCGGENLSKPPPGGGVDLGLWDSVIGGVLGWGLGGSAEITGLGALFGEKLIGSFIEFFADDPVDMRIIAYLTVKNDSLVGKCRDIDINNEKHAFLTVLPQGDFNDCAESAPCHRFAIDKGNPIKFVGNGGEWHVSFTVGADAATSGAPAPTYTRKSLPITNRLFLPVVTNNYDGMQRIEVTTRTVELQTLQFNVQFLTPWNQGTVEPGHWPNTDERAVAIGEALACYDLVALNESVNGARRQKIIETMRARAPTCGKPNRLLGESFFTTVSGPRMQDLQITDLKSALKVLRETRSYEDFLDAKLTSPLVGDEVSIISRYPIVSWHSYIYQSAYGIDSLAAKGAIHARIQVGDSAMQDYVDVFVTHLQSGDSAFKRAQILELSDFITANADPAIPIIVLGDFNIAGPFPGRLLTEGEVSNYDHVMAAFTTLPTGHVLQDIGLSLPKGTNENKEPAKHRYDRIDHIFLSPGFLAVDPSTVYVKEFDGNGWGTLSDHAGVEANIVWQKTTSTVVEGKPDLIVDGIQVAPEGVLVTIKNVGDAPAMPGNNFWIDMYISARESPTSVNQLWTDMGDYGLVWAVDSSTLPIPPGAQIVLTLSDPYFTAERSKVPTEIPAGSVIYVQVDSSGSAGYGGVLETHEELNGEYNNIASLTIQETINTAQWQDNISASNAEPASTQPAQTVMLTTPRDQ